MSREGRATEATEVAEVRGRHLPFVLCALCVLCGFVTLGGCHGSPYKLADMESRHLKSPFDTVDYFRYAIRAEDWDAVYESVSPETQKMIDERWGHGLEFKLGIARVKYGDLDKDAVAEAKDLPVMELVHRARIANMAPDPDNIRNYRVQLIYDPVAGKPALIPPKKTSIPLIDAPRPGERHRFTVGIAEWIQEQTAP